jgi:hypothetical protein
VEVGVCSSRLTVVDGKPVAPKLATLEVNLIGVFYCKQCSLPGTPRAWRHSRSSDPLIAVHLGMHYVMRNRPPSSWKAIVMIGSVGSYPHFALPPRQTLDQLTPTSHSVLGGPPSGATIYCLEARRVGSDARVGPRRRRRQHPHRRHSPMVCR